MLRRVTNLRSYLSSFSPTAPSPSRTAIPLKSHGLTTPSIEKPFRVLAIAVFLVVVPVFFQAPLVRSLPWFSLALTGTWLLAGVSLISRRNSHTLGDLLIGFTWTWLAGSIYWGWFRGEPFIHLPIEALGVPVVLTLLSQGKARVGCYFYLGSLLGTAVTDLYIYWTDLLPVWRQAMVLDPEWVPTLLQEAVATLHNSTAFGQGVILAVALLVIGVIPLRSKQPCWQAFSGAVLSTLLVDLLFLSSIAAV